MIVDQNIHLTRANVRFALSVLEHALDAGEPDPDQQTWLDFDYGTGQGLLMLVREVDKGVVELCNELDRRE